MSLASQQTVYTPEFFQEAVVIPGLEAGIVLPHGADSLFKPSKAARRHLSGLLSGEFYAWIYDGGERSELAAKVSALLEDDEDNLLAEFQNWLSTHHNVEFKEGGVNPEWMIVSGSTTQDIADLMGILNAEKGGQARFGAITPTYPDWIRETNEKYDGRLVSVPLNDTDEGWELDINALEAALPDMDVLFLCNPNNPTGHVFLEDEVRQIVRLCKEHDVKVISDEVFADKVGEGKKHTPLINAAIAEEYVEGVVMLYGSGKTFGTGAFPCSVAIIADAKLRQSFVDRESPKKKPSKEAARAATDCMREESGYVAGINRVLAANITYVTDVLSRAGFQSHPSDGAFIQAVRLSTSMDPDVIKRDMVDRALAFARAGIGVNDCARYGLPCYGRITLCAPYHIVQRQFDRLLDL